MNPLNKNTVVGKAVPSDEEGNNVQDSPPFKKQKTDLKPNLRTLTTIFNEVAQLAICHGHELVTYGAANQMKKLIKRNGSLCTGN